VNGISVTRKAEVVTSTGQQADSTPAHQAAAGGMMRRPSTTTRSGRVAPARTCAIMARSIARQKAGVADICTPTKKGASSRG
jgi:hypothetical protein